ncbi:MAG TPA: D-glycerate dehydrogenase [Gemmatimonadaceae bacterium]|nr:D-glycerate dehydrogenase [Gemmatimonadaceae bacterium]
MAAKPRVIVTRRLPPPVEKRATELFDATLNSTDTPLDNDGLLKAMAAADGLLPTVTDKVTAAVLGANPRRVRIVSNFGVGFNNIDIVAAKANGIVVTNTPDVLTDDTADIAITLMLSVARRAGEGERLVRAKEWKGWAPTHMLGTKVSGKTLGLIGIGRIGKAVAKRAHHGFGMRVIYHDPFPLKEADEKALGAEKRDSIEAVLAEADFVSLHCPATPETKHLMNSDRLARMKKSAFLINTARGDVVDEEALVGALTRNVIAGAGLDVYEREPVVAPQLLTMDNVVLLPHLGSATDETRVAMGMRAIDNLAAFFGGGAPRDRVA